MRRRAAPARQRHTTALRAPGRLLCEHCPHARRHPPSQELGLIGLWKRICSNDGSMPPRCSKQWYFSTFCAVDDATFEARRYGELGPAAPISEYLNGQVKPYDVCALLLALEEGAASSSASPPPASSHTLLARHPLTLQPTLLPSLRSRCPPPCHAPTRCRHTIPRPVPRTIAQTSRPS